MFINMVSACGLGDMHACEQGRGGNVSEKYLKSMRKEGKGDERTCKCCMCTHRYTYAYTRKNRPSKQGV